MPPTDTRKPPKDLGTPERFLWKSVVADLPDELVFDQRDLAVLGSACALWDLLGAEAECWYDEQRKHSYAT
jgi:hypothetical protein